MHYFSVVINIYIYIYNGFHSCGEDERPLNELIILQSGFEHPNGRYNVSMCKTFGNHWIQEKRKFLRTDHVVTQPNIFFISSQFIIQTVIDTELYWSDLDKQQSNLVPKNNGLLSHRSTDVDPRNPLICDLGRSCFLYACFLNLIRDYAFI